MTHTLLMIFVMLLPLIGSLFVLSAKDREGSSSNAFNVALMTLIVNICLTVGLFRFLPLNASAELKVIWTFSPSVDFAFGADILSLIFMLGLQISMLVGILGIKKDKMPSKNLLFNVLVYTALLNGYFLSRDLLSFYICFAGMLAPLYMLILSGLSPSKHKILEHLMMHYFLSAMLFLASLVMIFCLTQSNVLIARLPDLVFSHKKSIMVWGGLFMALILRVPVWPFHHTIISVSNAIKNPLVFIALNILPLGGIYAFMRFWPLVIPFEIAILSPVFQGLCVVTMIFAAFGGYAHPSAGHKLYHYIFVYDLLYLLAVFLPTNVIEFNIAYSVFAFMIISAGLVILQAHMSRQSSKLSSGIKGILCHMPRTSMVYALFVLAAVGLPISAFFWNNFVIIAEMFDFGLYTGTVVVISVTVAAVSMLENLYTLRVETCALSDEIHIKDLDAITFSVLILLMFALMLSFFKPLWFVV